MFRPKVILALSLVLLLLVLVVQNSEVVTVKLLLWQFEMSRVILILLAAVTGFVCGYVVCRVTSARPEAP